MLYADLFGERAEASPGARARCPICCAKVLAKCGEIVSWHWAHEANDCDPWSEPESEWHAAWKRRFPSAWREVKVGNHRADIKSPSLVIELQASAIPSHEIRQREAHYGRMLWLLRGEDFEENVDLRARSYGVSFRWKWPRKSWWTARRPVLVDFGGRILWVKKLHQNVPCGGWGNWISYDQLVWEAYGKNAQASVA